MSDLPKEKKEINGEIFVVHMLPLEEWQKLQLIVFPLIGSALESAALVVDNEEGELGEAKLLEAISKVVTDVVPKLKKKDYSTICSILGEATRVEGKQGFLTESVQQVFWAKNKYKSFGPWLKFAIATQFTDFLNGLGLKIGENMGTTKVTRDL